MALTMTLTITLTVTITMRVSNPIYVACRVAQKISVVFFAGPWEVVLFSRIEDHGNIMGHFGEDRKCL